MAIYTQKYEQKWLKINNRGGWNKDVPGGKKIGKLTIGGRGVGRLFGTREYSFQSKLQEYMFQALLEISDELVPSQMFLAIWL